eukprot:Colp12_sorted_trinity150504_noHs@1957
MDGKGTGRRESIEELLLERPLAAEECIASDSSDSVSSSKMDATSSIVASIREIKAAVGIEGNVENGELQAVETWLDMAVEVESSSPPRRKSSLKRRMSESDAKEGSGDGRPGLS